MTLWKWQTHQIRCSRHSAVSYITPHFLQCCYNCIASYVCVLLMYICILFYIISVHRDCLASDIWLLLRWYQSRSSACKHYIFSLWRLDACTCSKHVVLAPLKGHWVSFSQETCKMVTVINAYQRLISKQVDSWFRPVKPVNLALCGTTRLYRAEYSEGLANGMPQNHRHVRKTSFLEIRW